MTQKWKHEVVSFFLKCFFFEMGKSTENGQKSNQNLPWKEICNQWISGYIWHSFAASLSILSANHHFTPLSAARASLSATWVRGDAAGSPPIQPGGVFLVSKEAKIKMAKDDPKRWKKISKLNPNISTCHDCPWLSGLAPVVDLFCPRAFWQYRCLRMLLL